MLVLSANWNFPVRTVKVSINPSTSQNTTCFKEQTTGFALEEIRIVTSEHMGWAARFTLMTCLHLWKDVLIRNESGFT